MSGMSKTGSCLRRTHQLDSNVLEPSILICCHVVEVISLLVKRILNVCAKFWIDGSRRRRLSFSIFESLETWDQGKKIESEEKEKGKEEAGKIVRKQTLGL